MKNEDGQSTVEFALILPLVTVLALAVVQLGFVVYAQIDVVHSAREVARSMTVNPELDVGHLANEVTTLRSELVQSSVEQGKSPTTGRDVIIVTVTARVPPVSRLFEGLLDGFQVTSRVQMVVESR